MGKTRKTKQRRARKWVVALALLLVISIVGFAGWVAFFRGRRKSGVLDRAIEAARMGDSQQAEALLREALAANPKSRNANLLLLRILLDDGRFDEAEEAASAWLEAGDEDLVPRQFLVEVAVRRGAFERAEVLARSLADRVPEFAHLTILRIRDVKGGLADRLVGVGAAVDLAAITDSLALKAEMLLYAGETVLELAGRQTEPTRARMVAQARHYLTEAQRALDASDLGGIELRTLTARLELLSESEATRQLGERELRGIVGESPQEQTYGLRAALARHYARTGDWPRAFEQAQAMADGPYLTWWRAVTRFVDAGRRMEALELIEDGPETGSPLTSLIRARVLIAGEADEQAQARAILRKLVEEDPDNRGLGVAALRMLGGAENTKERIRLLETMADADPQVHILALLASQLSATPEGTARAGDIISEIADRIGGAGETTVVLAALRAGGEDSLRAYLEQPLPEGEAGRRARASRLLAASVLATRNPDAPEAGFLRERAIYDLTQLSEDPDASKTDIANLWPLGLTLQRPDLAGVLAGRSLAQEGPPYVLGWTCLGLGERTSDEEARASFANGLLAGIGENGPKAFGEVLAAAVRARSTDRGALLSQLEATAADDASRIPALFLVVRVAFAEGDREAAEKCARQLVELLPSSVEARELLGDLLLEQGRFEEVLEIQPEPDGRSIHPYRQRAVALVRLDRIDEALDTARAAVRELPGDGRAHLLLADVHLQAGREGATTAALAVLGVAPMTRGVTMRRAGLLAGRGEHHLAGLLYKFVLERLPNDAEAWAGLGAVLTRQGRLEDAEQLLSQKIEQLDEGAPPLLRGTVLIARARVHEGAGHGGEALGDYEAALRDLPRSLVALNNASWLITQQEPERIEEARELISRALEIFDASPQIHDTAAVVEFVRGDNETALRHANRSLELEERKGTMLHRAEILLAMGKEADARTQLEEIIEKFPDSSEAGKAETMLGD